MDTLQLDLAIKAKGFLGAFTYDDLPEKAVGDFSIVVNTAASNQAGTNWLALLYKSKKWYFLDSYGRTLTDDTFSNSFVKVIKDYTGGKLVYNKQWLQQITSNVCGQYSVYFITEMQYKKLGDVLKVFTTNLAKNDSFVRNYVK